MLRIVIQIPKVTVYVLLELVLASARLLCSVSACAKNIKARRVSLQESNHCIVPASESRPFPHLVLPVSRTTTRFR